MITINRHLKLIAQFLAAVLLGQVIRFAYFWLHTKCLLYKRQLVASMIEGDLEGKDLTIDLKTKQQKKASSLTHEDMQKVIWVLNVQNEQLKDTLETVKSAIGYHETGE